MKTTIIFLMLLMPSISIAAEFSVMPYAGWTHYRESVSGTWRQEPLPYGMDNNAAHVGVQFGWRPKSWVRFTASYFYRQDTGGEGIFVSDAEYKEKFGGSKETAVNSDDKYYAKWETRMQGIVLAVEPVWQVNSDWEVFGQIGSEFYASTFILKDHCRISGEPSPANSINFKRGYEMGCPGSVNQHIDPRGSNWSSSMYYGAGVSYKNWTLTVYTVPDEQPTISGFNGSYGANVGYRFTF